MPLANPPAVSVVIATFNRANFLAETIDSVLGQKFQDFELIVVDDGSTDDTANVLATYGSRIRYFRKSNRGPSAARNLGVQQALAPWIAIQDSDDLSAPIHLELLYGYVRNHPDCAMVFANGSYISGVEHNRETIIPQKKSVRLAADGVQLVDLFDKSVVRLQAALISKRCYDEVGGHDESLRISMDLDLSFRLFSKYPVAYLDAVVFSYRKHSGNISGDQELRLLENIRVIEKLLKENPQAKEVLGRRRVEARLAYRYYRLAKGRWKKGEQEQCREALREAIRLRPFYPKYRVYQLKWGY